MFSLRILLTKRMTCCAINFFGAVALFPSFPRPRYRRKDVFWNTADPVTDLQLSTPVERPFWVSPLDPWWVSPALSSFPGVRRRPFPRFLNVYPGVTALLDRSGIRYTECPVSGRTLFHLCPVRGVLRDLSPFGLPRFATSLPVSDENELTRPQTHSNTTTSSRPSHPTVGSRHRPRPGLCAGGGGVRTSMYDHVYRYRTRRRPPSNLVSLSPSPTCLW